jgi:glutamyl-tRNA synthetase
MVEISLKVIKAHTLENSIKHNGEANKDAILSGLFAEGLEKKDVKEFIPKIKEVIKEVSSLSLEEQKKELEKLDIKTSKRESRTGLPELINAKKGEVIMRFAPFPSGPLHIGNARPLILNDEYVKTYGGKLILFMDDTIGSEAKPIEPESYKLIEDGIEWLGIKVDKKIIYKSDRIKKYYEYAEELIKKGYMYVCACSREEIAELKLKQIECSCRQFSSEEQLKRWKEMFVAREGTRTVRLKTSMDNPDPAFRDRIMFRISDRPHAKLGKKYRVYPLLDFTWAIDDHIFGITHILRGNDLMMETKVEKFIWDIFKWKHPEIIYNGQFTIEGIEISKSKGSNEVRSGEYLGWNDPRTWSLQSLRDRGITTEALREFILNMGIKKTNVTIPIDALYALNNKNLNDAPRYFFIENPTKITIKGTPDLTAKIPLNPNRTLGDKIYKTTQEFLIDGQDFGLMQNKNYRLMHLLNFKSDNILRMKPREFSFVSEKPDNNLKTKFIHWLPANEKNINVEIRMPNNKIIKGLGEPKLSDLKIGTIIQFERFGFVRLYKKNKSGMEFWFANN